MDLAVRNCLSASGVAGRPLCFLGYLIDLILKISRLVHYPVLFAEVNQLALARCAFRA